MPDDTQEPKIEEIKGEDFIDESNESIAEFLDETPIDEIEDEEPVETTDEEDKEDIPEEEKSPVEPIVEDEKPKEIPIEEVIEKTTQRTLESMGMTKEEKKELEDEGFKFAWEQRGEDRPASWKEQSEETIRLWQYNQQKNQEKLNEVQKVQIIENEKKNKEVNDYWDEQLEELRADGLLPQISPEVKKKISEGKALSKIDRNDAGLKAQLEVFEKMYELSQQRELEGKKPITDIHHIYHRFISKKPKQPEGAIAPVSGGTKTVPMQQSEELNYQDIHNLDFEDIIKS